MSVIRRRHTVQYAPVAVTPHRSFKSGPAVLPDWPQRYLAHLEHHAHGWLAAKQAGVAYKTVQRLRDRDPQFAEDEQDALKECAGLHEVHLDRIAEGDDMPAVTANIVRLKALDPMRYVEKAISVSASFTTELPADDGKLLLQAMFSVLPPPAALEQTRDDAAR